MLQPRASPRASVLAHSFHEYFQYEPNLYLHTDASA